MAIGIGRVERVIAESSYGRENGILDAQTAEISDYGVDPDTGNYTIPIDEAMKMLVADSPKEDHKADEPSHGADDHKDEETHSKKDDDTSESKDELSL